MLRKTPPLAAVEAFLAAAGADSFRAAADDLALSPSAFSRRIQMLERFVGAPLFDRSGPVVRLTERGQRYREAIEPAMQTIGDATAKIRGVGRSEPLRLSTSQSFAVDWLMPRLAVLRERCDITVELVIVTGVQSLRTGEADLAIVGGETAPTDFGSETLIELDAAPVSAPILANGQPRPTSVTELEDHILLAMRSPPNLWRKWLLAADGVSPALRSASHFESSHVMYEAAANGLGVTLATPLASERYLRDGRLAPCFADRRPIGMSYRLVHRTADILRRKPAARFRDWLAEDVRQSNLAFAAAVQRSAA